MSIQNIIKKNWQAFITGAAITSIILFMNTAIPLFITYWNDADAIFKDALYDLLTQSSFIVLLIVVSLFVMSLYKRIKPHN
ncbi:MAG: hypothetical protein QM500_16880 [Methylococcales bacterium]